MFVRALTAGLLALVLAACASADLGENNPDGAVNSPIDAHIDARGDDLADASEAPDATPAPDADPNCTPDWQQLLGNGGFEAGRTIWNEDTGGSANAIIRQEGGGLPFNAAAGSWAALVLGYNLADVTLSQAVTVPADATMLRLRTMRCWVTSETAGANDTMTIELRDNAGGLLETLASVSNADAGAVCSWEIADYTASEAHAGQTVQLTFDAVANGSNPTSFAFDDLVLEAYACP